MSEKRITVAYGDGIGPEIMKVALKILLAGGAQLEIDEIEIGKSVYLRGVKSGIEPSAWESLRRNKVFFKAPITTPQGGGYQSLNVATRTALGLYANVRPCRSYAPFVRTHHPEADIVIIRENEEDLYTGIEYRQTREVVESLKLVSRPGSERVVRYAFEYAKAYGRKKVTCFSKDNIMKMTDGLFHKTFDEIGAEYPGIEKDHKIIDIGSALLADRPDTLDVIVTLNLYGDIVSDIAAQVTGSVGLGGSANIGRDAAMFEAIHGSAPDIAGKNIANPSGLLNAGVMMLMHLGQREAAERVMNAWLSTIEEGIHTGDIYQEGRSRKKANTTEFAEAVIERLGRKPERLPAVSFTSAGRLAQKEPAPTRRDISKKLLGVDVFIDWDEDRREPAILGEKLKNVSVNGLKLQFIANRGANVYPEGLPETYCTDHWRCRFVAAEGCIHRDIVDLLQTLSQAGFDFIKTENLYAFDGVAGYSGADL